MPLPPDARSALKAKADGDGRFCLNFCEELFALPEDGALLDNNALATAIQRRAPLYDKAQEGHYNLISALYKSLRGSVERGFEREIKKRQDDGARLRGRKAAQGDE